MKKQSLFAAFLTCLLIFGKIVRRMVTDRYRTASAAAKSPVFAGPAFRIVFHEITYAVINDVHVERTRTLWKTAT